MTRSLAFLALLLALGLSCSKKEEEVVESTPGPLMPSIDTSCGSESCLKE